MTIDQFFQLLESHNRLKRGTHKLNKPLTDEQLAAWQKKHKTFKLPNDFIQLLRRSNGLTLNPNYAYMANGVLRLLSVKEMDWAPKVWWEDGEPFEDEDECPKDWLCIGRDGNGDWNLVLDTARGKYIVCEGTPEGDPADENDGAGSYDTLEAMLDWASDLIQAPAEPPAKAKGGKSRRKGPKIHLVETLRIVAHFEHVTVVAALPDGRILSGAASDKDPVGGIGEVLRLFDSADGRLIRSFVEAGECSDWHGPSAIAISPDARRVLLQTPDSLALLDIESGRRLRYWDSHSPHGLAISPDGHSALAADWKDLVWVDLESGRELARLAGHRDQINAILFTPDGRQAISTSNDKTIRLWDLAAKAEVPRFARQTSPATAAVFSPDGRRLATGHWVRGLIQLFDPDSSKVLLAFGKQKGPVNCLAFSPDGRQIAAAGSDGTLRLYDAASGDELAKFTVEGGDNLQTWERGRSVVTGVAFFPDGQRLATSSWDGTARVLAISSKPAVQPPRQVSHLDEVARLVPPAGESDPGEIRRIEADKTLSRPTMSSDGKWLAVQTDDQYGAISLYAWPDLQVVRTLAPKARAAYPMSISRDGRLLLAIELRGDREHVLTAWDTQTGQRTAEFCKMDDAIFKAILLPDGKRVLALVGGGGENLRLWDVATGQQIGQLPQHVGGVGLDVSPDGKLAVAGGGGDLVYVDTQTMTAVSLPPLPAQQYADMFRFLDGQHIVWGDENRNLTVWDVVAGKPLAQIALERGAAEILPRPGRPGQLLVSVRDCGIEVWDWRAGQRLHRFPGRASGYMQWPSMAAHPDGRHLITTKGKLLRVWRLPVP